MNSKKFDENNTATIRQGFLGGPSRVVYVVGSEKETTDLAERLMQVIKDAGGIEKFLVEYDSLKDLKKD